MIRKILLVSFVLSALLALRASAQIPALPGGAQTKWVVDDPEEIVGYLIFDPSTVQDRLPSSLRFITVGELAASQISWAMEHLDEYPAHAGWGISFIEIVRMGTFDIDGRSPKWLKQGAAALWCARVAPSDSTTELGPGQPFLVLEFWMSDSSYVAYMREKGHYATFGDVHLRKNASGKWSGSINVQGLSASCNCTPSSDVTSSGSSAMQVFFPPAQSGITSFVRLALAGHQARQCNEEVVWKVKGAHPLAKGMMLGPSSFEFGYHLIGGAYR
jgi:hypothetical protein